MKEVIRYVGYVSETIKFNIHYKKVFKSDISYLTGCCWALFKQNRRERND